MTAPESYSRVVIQVTPLDGSLAYEIEAFQVTKPVLNVEYDDVESSDGYLIGSTPAIRTVEFSFTPLRREEDGIHYIIREIKPDPEGDCPRCAATRVVQGNQTTIVHELICPIGGKP